MKKTYTTIIIALMSINCLAQFPYWQWAKSSGGSGSDAGNSVVTDTYGNIIVGGTFTSPTISFGNLTLTNNGIGTHDIFIVKYTSVGTVIWAKSFGGNNDDYSTSIAIDSLGNIVFAGSYSSPTIAFGTTILNNAGNSGTYDMFFVKMNAAGNNVIWANSTGGIAHDGASDLTMDALGNILIAGYFGSTTISFNSIVISSVGDDDIFIVKYSPNGNALWVKTVVGPLSEHPFHIATDTDGNVIITAVLQSFVINFGSYILNNPAVNYMDNIFMIKYSSSGTFLWVKEVQKVQHSMGESWISTDNLNNIIIASCFTAPTVTFDNITLTNSGQFSSPDIFVVKYDGAGNVQWAKSAGGTNYELMRSLLVDANDDIIIAGQFKSQSIFNGSNTLFNFYYYFSDMFVAKYSSSGNLIWTKSIGDMDDDDLISAAITEDAMENLIITGGFESPSISIGTTTLNSAGYDDIFLAKINFLYVSTINPTACDSYTSPSGNLIWYNTGYYTDTIHNVVGFDSLINVHLTINQSYNSTANISACDSFLWVNGQTYTISNNSDSYTYNLASGCDSTITLNLTLHNSNTYIDVITACNSYKWIDGQTYTVSNYNTTHALTNLFGCDSIVTLNLTINYLDTSITQNNGTYTANATGASYQWLDCNNFYTALPNDTNQSFTPILSGNYAISISTSNCIDTSSCYNLFVVGLEANKNSSIQIYPNPVNNQFNLKKRELPENIYPIYFSLYNIEAQLCLTKKLFNDNIEESVMTSQLPNGIYSWQINNNASFHAAGKIIINH